MGEKRRNVSKFLVISHFTFLKTRSARLSFTKITSYWSPKRKEHHGVLLFNIYSTCATHLTVRFCYVSTTGERKGTRDCAYIFSIHLCVYVHVSVCNCLCVGVCVCVCVCLSVCLSVCVRSYTNLSSVQSLVSLLQTSC